ncbi:MAG: lasso peptide biosynthesis B2 protein [Acidaminococcaceae bacterium]
MVNMFFSLPWREQSLLLIVFWLSGLVRATTLLLPFACLAPFLGKQMAESPPNFPLCQEHYVRQVSRNITIVSRNTPWESKCLVQAIVGKIMLRRLAVNNTLYLGVGRDEKDKLIAHAWLRCGTVFVSGGAGRERFTVVGKFADL